MKSKDGISARYVLGGVLFALALLRLAAAPYADQAAQLKFRSGVTPRRQARPDRVWDPWGWRKLRSIALSGSLEGPVYPHIAADDSLVVYDAPNYAVRRISPAGVMRESIAIPAEVFLRTTVSLTDVAPAEDGAIIWGCNPNGNITGFDRAGRVLYTLPRTARGMRLAVFRDRLIATQVGSEHLFGAYTKEGRTVAQFGEVLEEQPNSLVLTDGWLAADASQQAFYYAPRYDGFLASYKINGASMFLVQTIDALPLPTLGRRADGGVNYPTLLASVSYIAARGDKLYVLVNRGGVVGEPSAEPTTLDTYSARDGSYLSSSVMPGRYIGIALGHGVGYTIGAAGVDIWALPLAAGSPGPGRVR